MYSVLKMHTHFSTLHIPNGITRRNQPPVLKTAIQHHFVLKTMSIKFTCMSQYNARCSRYSYYDQSHARVIFHNLLNSNHKGMYTLGEWVLLGILGGGVLPSSINPHSISDQKNVIFHTHFQNWPLRNYVIITLLSLWPKQEVHRP